MSQVSSKRIQITNQLYPAYYTQFSCIADRCQNNCCDGWNISFGKKEKYHSNKYPPFVHSVCAKGGYQYCNYFKVFRWVISTLAMFSQEAWTVTAPISLATAGIP